jgi:hypothetical protein
MVAVLEIRDRRCCGRLVQDGDLSADHAEVRELGALENVDFRSRPTWPRTEARPADVLHLPGRPARRQRGNFAGIRTHERIVELENFAPLHRFHRVNQVLPVVEDVVLLDPPGRKTKATIGIRHLPYEDRR